MSQVPHFQNATTLPKKPAPSHTPPPSRAVPREAEAVLSEAAPSSAARPSVVPARPLVPRACLPPEVSSGGLPPSTRSVDERVSSGGFRDASTGRDMIRLVHNGGATLPGYTCYVPFSLSDAGWFPFRKRPLVLAYNAWTPPHHMPTVPVRKTAPPRSSRRPLGSAGGLRLQRRGLQGVFGHGGPFVEKVYTVYPVDPHTEPEKVIGAIYVGSEGPSTF